jgi:hypothetical protein
MPAVALDHDVGFQEGEHEPQDLAIPDAAAHPIHQHMMIDGVEGSGGRLPITVIFRIR